MSYNKGRSKRIKKVIKKATRGTGKLPKEKHVRNIVLSTFNRDDSIEEITRSLLKRLDKPNWIVVLKALQIFHRCYKDGDAQFIESLKPRSQSVFGLRRFNQSSNLKGHVITIFIRKYAKYLEEKVSVLRLLGFQFEKQTDSCKKLKLDVAFKRIPKLQSQLNALLNCKMRSQHVTQNSLIVTTYALLLKDSLVLYRILNEGIVGLLDRFQKMNKKDSQKTLEIYKLFIRETEALISLYDIGRHFTRGSLPEIKKPKASIVQSMEKHIAKMKGGDAAKESEEDEDAQTGDDIIGYNDKNLQDSSISGESDPDALNVEGDDSADDEDDEEGSDSSEGEEDLPDPQPLPFDITGSTKVPSVLGGIMDPFASNSSSAQPSFVPDFGSNNNVTGSNGRNNSGILAPDTSGSQSVNYEQKATNIKSLAEGLYSTNFDNFNNQFANKTSSNPFSTMGTDQGFPTTFHSNPNVNVFNTTQPVHYRSTSMVGSGSMGNVQQQPQHNPHLFNTNPTPQYHAPPSFNQVSNSISYGSNNNTVTSNNPFSTSPPAQQQQQNAQQQNAQQPQRTQSLNPFL